MSLKVIYKEQDIKSYKKKKTIYLFVYYFEDLSQMFHQRFGCLPINWAGLICVCVGVGGRQQSPFPLSLVYFNLHSLIQQMPIEQVIWIRQAPRYYNIYTKILIYKAWSVDYKCRWHTYVNLRHG